MSGSIYFDTPHGGLNTPGDFASPVQVGPVVMKFENGEGGATIARYYVYKYWQLAETFNRNFASYANGISFLSRDAFGAYFVNGTDPTDVGAGLVEYSLTYCLLPPIRMISESRTHTFQVFLDGLTLVPYTGKSVNRNLVEFTITVPVKIVRTYFATNDPSSIPCAIAPRVVRVADDLVAYLGGEIGAGRGTNAFSNLILTPPGNSAQFPPNLKGYFLGEDEVVRPWKGLIWERESIYVPYRVPLA